MEDERLNPMEYFNESMIMIMVYAMMGLTDV
jgi:hypothetical protein